MKHSIGSVLLYCALIAVLGGCRMMAPAYKTTGRGLKYRIIKDEPGTRHAVVGDNMDFHITTSVRFPKGDSLLFDSRKMNNNIPVPYQVAAPTFNGDLNEGLMMLTEGDSAVFRIPVDSVIRAGNAVVSWMEAGKGQQMVYTVKVVRISSPDQQQQEMKAAAERQAATDEALIREYLETNHIAAARTASGLYYSSLRPGDKQKPAAGDSVSINYTGKTLNEIKFDSNTDPAFHHVSPFWFRLGAGQVIRGWDEGIALFTKGAKGTLFIPSHLGYGPQSPSAQIPGNAVLIFEVEVIDVHTGKRL